MTKTWIGIDVSCAPENADDLAAEVAEALGSGVEVTPQGLRFYVEQEGFTDEYEYGLKTLLARFEETFGAASRPVYSHFELKDDSWADSWKAYFKPLRIGRSFLICPTWEDILPSPQDLLIRLDPGRAFGTGHHESTRLCLQWLEEASAAGGLRDRSVLDVGTGSGVLAIGAALLGCDPVLGIDVDEDAVAVAAENIILNQMAFKIRVAAGAPSDVDGSFHIVLANIEALPLIRMAPDLIRCCAPGGRLVLSGILNEQRERVLEAYRNKGLKLADSEVSGEWCMLALER